MKRKTFIYSFKTSLPVMAGYLFLGIGFGILLQSKGYGPLWAFCMSLFIYAGSLQYVAVDLIGAGASLITASIMTVMVQIRHLFYGISMLDKYSKAGKYKYYCIYAMTDETFSLVCNPYLPKDIDRNAYYFYLSALNHSYWIIGGVIGNILGNFLPFSSRGIDFSMTSLFLIIMFTQWEENKDHKPVITGIVTTLICRIIFGPNNFLIPAMIIITIVLFALRRYCDVEPNKNNKNNEEELTNASDK